MLLMLACRGENGHTCILYWMPHDMPAAVEEIVNWWRDGLLTRGDAIEVIQTCKRMTDAELERGFLNRATR